MNRMRRADRLRRCLAEPEVTHLALRDQLGHRPDGVLDGDGRVDAVLVAEVYVVGAKAREHPSIARRTFAGEPSIRRLPSGARCRTWSRS
jgi:hypothetical protein